MIDLAQKALTPVVLIYVVSAMLALGLGQTVRQIFDPLRNLRTVVTVVVASYIILPLMAATIARLFNLDPGLRHGLVLFAMAAGAEIGPLKTANSNANVRLSGAILVLSIGITIIYLPVMLGVLMPDVHFDLIHLLMKLCLTIVAPLVVGLLVKSRFDKFAHASEKFMHVISRVFVLLLTLIVIVLYYERIIELIGTFAILAGFFLVAGGFAVGYLLGSPDHASRLAMGYMHGARNASIAVMVANDVFRDEPDVMLMIATVVILVLVILLPLSFALRIKRVHAHVARDQLQP